MNEVVYLIMRQMRRPALILLGTYSLAMLGISLIPAINSEGELTYLSLFQAFYWISYTATTIGFGELPQAFSEWQRMWVVLSIYYTVPAWFYAIGKVIALLQDPTFQHALSESRFARQVEKQRSRFCIICGFGESGQRLVRLLLNSGYQCVVIDSDPVRINKMALDPSLHGVLAITGDAFSVELLLKAGVQSPHCRAVIAITDSEAVNIKVSLAARLLTSDQTRFQVICRTYTRAGSANAKSFNTDATINTNQIFALRLTTALRRPAIAELITRLQSTPGERYESPPQPPMGHWIICGNDALGKTLKRYLDYEGVDCTIIDPDLPTAPGQVRGIGTEAVTLREARIDRAQAIVAAYKSDSDNLSIAVTAKNMQPSLFVVGKQNHSSDQRLFAVAGFDRVMAEADLIVSEIYPRIAQSLLSRFMKVLWHQNEAWGQKLLQRLENLSGDYNPRHHILKVDKQRAPAIITELQSGRLLRLQSLWMLPDRPETANDAIPLLILRNQQQIVLPNAATSLQEGDQVLIIYHQPDIGRRIQRAARDENELYYATHGRDKPVSHLTNYLRKKLDL